MISRYREWCEQPNRRKGRMYKEEDFNKLIRNLQDPGYSSVYSFSEADAQEIKESGMSRGMSKYEVGADRLTIDIDRDILKEAQEVMSTVVRKLDVLGYTYEVWFSGGKGFHIIIPHELIVSKDLPYSHKIAVEKLAIPNVDYSLYQHSRVLSLPGRIHPKTRKKKSLVTCKDGDMIDIQIVEKPSGMWNFIDVVKDPGMIFSQLSYAYNANPMNGSRHKILWGTAKDMAESGISYDLAKDLLLFVNSKWSSPKEESEVLRALNQGYGREG